MVPDVFHPLMKYHSRKVDHAMTPGLNQLTWTSLNVGPFLQKVETSISQFERLTKQVLCYYMSETVPITILQLYTLQVMDLYECRIKANLSIMSRTLLLTLPQNEAWTTAHFLQEASAHSEAGGNVLSSCSKKVEDAVKELLELLRNTAATPTINSFDSEEIARSKRDELEVFQTHCQDLFIYFKHRNLDALIASVRGTLDNLRRCITTSTLRSGIRYGINPTSLDDSSHPTACFQADLILSIPNIVMQPSLEDMQNTVNQAVHYICEVGQHIGLWTIPMSSAHLTSPRSAGKNVVNIVKGLNCH